MTKAKGSAAHYRERIERLRRRAAYLRARLKAGGYPSEGAMHHDRAEASALEWAIAQLEPWYAKDEAEAPVTPEIVG
ncbi:MAG TPA: hypothetical protein VKR23_16055 [Gaiellaceae bacterium]|nr:hypothetical protein [Gaiellaceae bacterium]